MNAGKLNYVRVVFYCLITTIPMQFVTSGFAQEVQGAISADDSDRLSEQSELSLRQMINELRKELEELRRQVNALPRDSILSTEPLESGPGGSYSQLPIDIREISGSGRPYYGHSFSYQREAAQRYRPPTRYPYPRMHNFYYPYYPYYVSPYGFYLGNGRVYYYYSPYGYRFGPYVNGPYGLQYWY